MGYRSRAPLRAGGPRSARRIVTCLLGAALACAVIAPIGGAASGTTVVTATVPSATSVDVGTCITGTADVTSFGTVMPGTPTTTGTDCTITWGSSNDTSMLRLARQSPDVTSAMHSTGWSAIATGTGSTVHDLEVLDRDSFWIVGSGGMARRSEDGGATWSPQNTTVGVALYAMAAASPDVAWAVGQGGTVVYTDDGGATWATQTSNTANGLRGVVALDEQTAWAVGDNVIIRTEDAGTTWVVQNPGVGHNLWRIRALDASTAWASGGSGRVLRTTDGGASWTNLTAATGTTAALEGLALVGDSLLFASGGGGTMIRSDDGGDTWTPLATGATDSLEYVEAADSGMVLAIEDTTDTLRRSYDGGASWTSESTGTGASMERVIAYDADTIFVFGAGGTMAQQVEADPVADYSLGSTDFLNGASAFGACLRAVSGAGVTAGWTVDATCGATDGAHWNAIPATTGAAAAKVAASTTSGLDTATASLRFGFRPAATQPAGTYQAALRFEVVAPDA